MKAKKIELLAPAGNRESFIAAVQNGANAVYMGLEKFNARVMANNFTKEEYISCIDYAHIRGVKIYLTLNTLVYDDEMKDALKDTLELYKHGLDGVIVQDIGIATLIHKYIPELPLHASTQMTIHNLDQVKFLEKQGFARIVLSRELNIEEIEYICDNTSLEIEVFVHGALCTSYSGQCLMSSAIGDRSGNRGSCAQPCRKRYSLSKKSLEFGSNGSIQSNRYLLSKKDIFGLEYIGKLRQAGVSSLKIEGRNKTPEYTATVVSKYRKYIDNKTLKIDEIDKKELEQIFSRSGISTGYLNGVLKRDSITAITPKNTGLELGIILNHKDKYIKVILSEDVDMHDGIEIYTDGKSLTSTIVTCIKDESGNIINDIARAGSIVYLGDIKAPVDSGSTIYKTSSKKLNSRLENTWREDSNLIKRKIKGKVTLKLNENMIFEVFDKDGDKYIRQELEYIVTSATGNGTSDEDILKSLNKVQDTPFIFTDINLEIDARIFIPISKLNELRREALAKLQEEYIIDKDVNNILEEIDKLDISEVKSCKNVNNKENTNIVHFLKFDIKNDYFKYVKSLESKLYINIEDIQNIEDMKDVIEIYKCKIYLVIPNIVNINTEQHIKKNIEDFVKAGVCGIIVGNIGYIDISVNLKNKYNIELIADYTLNITNSFSALFYDNLGFDKLTLSIDIDYAKTKELAMKFEIECSYGYIKVMTSRYCILTSWISDDNSSEDKNIKCKGYCKSEEYYITDEKGERYYIICNKRDCIMSLVRELRNFNQLNDMSKYISIRQEIM